MTKKMHALVKAKKEPGAEYREVNVPELRADEVLVKVEAAAICGSDLHIYNWNKYASDRVNPPLIFGHEFFGEIVAKGDQVHSASLGDKIAAETHLPCGNCFQCRTGDPHICPSWVAPGIHFDGGFAEFISIPQILTVKMPEDTVPEIGAIYEPFGVALHAILLKNITAKTIVIFGCGPIGLFAVAAARLSGASKIVAVEPSPCRLDLAKKMGATITVDPNVQPVVQRIREVTDDVGVDAAFEFSGSHIAAEQAFEAIRNGGSIFLVGVQSKNLKIDWSRDVIYKEAKVYGITGREMFKTWYQARAILDSKAVDVGAVITHTFGLAEFKEAFEIANSGQCGKIVFKM